jgi:hypothetical protein
MNWNGKTYKLIPVTSVKVDGTIDHSCAGCAFEHESLFDNESGCEQAGDGCIGEGEDFLNASFVWQEQA